VTVHPQFCASQKRTVLKESVNPLSSQPIHNVCNCYSSVNADCLKQTVGRAVLIKDDGYIGVACFGVYE